jgi:L-lactate dehydrogenase complex protein LldG
VSDARRRILDALRQAAGPGSSAPQPVVPRRFDWDAQERLRRFREGMEAIRGEVQLVAADWPARVCGILQEKGARNLLYGPGGPLGRELERGWPEGASVSLVPYLDDVETFRDTLFVDIDAAFTSCRGGIAETGSIALWPTRHEPRLMSLVPPIHLVLLPMSTLVSTFAELLSEQAWAGGMPTNALLVSGPSKSADIEQTLAYGVHGPKELVILVRTDQSSVGLEAPGYDRQGDGTATEMG